MASVTKHIQLLSLAVLLGTSTLASAQENFVETVSTNDIQTFRQTATNSDLCIRMMAGFPDDSLANRYQFYRLINMMENGVDSGVLDALDHFGARNSFGQDTVIDVVTNLSDPVMLQSAPRYSIGNAAQLIEYAQTCRPFINAQIASIEVAEPSVTEARFEEQLAEDAVYLRALVVQSLESVSAHIHPIHGPAVTRYQNATINIRNEAEFVGFEAELDALSFETLAEMDQQLVVQQQVVEGDIDKEIVSSSTQMVQSMNQASKEESNQKVNYIMWRILNSRVYY
jgi:hypothetical protein